MEETDVQTIDWQKVLADCGRTAPNPRLAAIRLLSAAEDARREKRTAELFLACKKATGDTDTATEIQTIQDCIEKASLCTQAAALAAADAEKAEATKLEL